MQLWYKGMNISFQQEKRRRSGGSIKDSALWSVKVYCVNHRDPFLKRMERALYVWLEDDAQKWLSVSGDVGQGEDHANKDWFANCILSQEPCIQGPPCS